MAVASCFDPPGRRFELAQRRADDVFGLLAFARMVGLLESQQTQKRKTEAVQEQKSREKYAVDALVRFVNAYVTRLTAHERWLKTSEALRFLGLPPEEAEKTKTILRLQELAGTALEQAKTRLKNLKSLY